MNREQLLSDHSVPSREGTVSVSFFESGPFLHNEGGLVAKGTRVSPSWGRGQGPEADPASGEGFHQPFERRKASTGPSRTGAESFWGRKPERSHALSGPQAPWGQKLLCPGPCLVYLFIWLLIPIL